MANTVHLREYPPVLQLLNLTVTYATEKGPLDTVRNVSLKIHRGEIFGLVGESGSGKTTLARAVVRYLPRNGSISNGSVLLNDQNLLNLSSKDLRRVWGSKITMVPQEPAKAINPAIPVGEQVAEVARVHLNLTRAQAWQKALNMLSKVQLSDPETVARRYAHELSGGMLQRILIATALVTNPDLLIMDEPTTALDVTTEAVILDLINDLLHEYQTAVLYITHNLGVVARMCNRVGVMYAGELIEEGSTQQIFQYSSHPYTLGLLSCVPRVDRQEKNIVLHSIPGFIPRPDSLPDGCIFAPRCAIAIESCHLSRPPLVEVETTRKDQFEYNRHFSACFRWAEVESNKKTIISPALSRPKEDTISRSVVLDTKNIKKQYKVKQRGLDNLLSWKPTVIQAVDDISMRIHQGRTVGFVGESGSGKTTFARCIAGLEKATNGEIVLEGELLSFSVSDRPTSILKKIQVIFQNHDASLNPQHPVGKTVARPLALFENVPREQIDQHVRELFKAVNLPEDYVYRLPHELSGGEKQRVAIARAFAANPSLIICDEPISSLDVSVQASLMNLLLDLQKSQDISYLFISHDLAAIRHLSDWIAVVYLGRLWETGSAEDVFAPPYHPYTEALLSAIPIPNPDMRQEYIRLQGSVPSAVNIPPGCRFHTRCPRKIGEICETVEPPWQQGANYHRICCHIPIDNLSQIQGQILDYAVGREPGP